MVAAISWEPELLSDVLVQVHQQDDPQSAINTLLTGACASFGAAHAFYLALNRPLRRFETLAFTGTDGEPLSRLKTAGFELPASVEYSVLWPLLNDLHHRGLPVAFAERLSDLLGDAWGPGLCIGIQSVLRARALAVAVVPASDAPVGLFVLMSVGEWPHAALRIATAHTAVALANIYRHFEAARYHEIDPETWVFTQQHVEDVACRELQRALRYHHELSLLLIEPAADEQPRAMARVIATHIARTLRASDSLGRYGVRGFLAVLPETGELGAKRSIDRLAESSTGSSLQLRVGCASLPNDGDTLAALTDIAAGRLTLLEASTTRSGGDSNAQHAGSQ